MTYKEFNRKVKDKLWSKIHGAAIGTPLYLYIFKSYWHYRLHARQEFKPTGEMYYGARPNPGAGIGHQMANWIDGYYWATKRFGMNFVHFHFSTKKWDDFLGFGYGEPTVEELRKRGYKLRRLPAFKDTDPDSVELVKAIMASYQGEKVMFWPPQDHFYREQYGVMDEIQRKFRNAPAREGDKLIYELSNFNIAMHVRRGDIMGDPNSPIMRQRFLSNDYFEKVLRQVLYCVKSAKPVHVYFFSQGVPEDYPEFADVPNLHWCLTMGAQDSFLHMVFADLLITSKSSFSYKPALLNRGIKVCPRNFWHGYPDTPDWILCENDGAFDSSRLKGLLN